MSVVELVPSTVPARARRIGGTPAPRIRRLDDILPGPPGPCPVAAPDDGARTRAAQDELDRIAAALRPVAVWLLTAVVDVLAGRRRPEHLDALLARDARTELARATAPPGPRAVGPPVLQAPRTRARLRGLRVCAVAPRVVEVAAVIHGQGSVRALAARLERVDDAPTDPGRWHAVTMWAG